MGSDPMHMGTRDRAVFVELFAGGIVLLLADTYALRWVGMWMGLRARGHHRAILATLGRVMILPWLGVVFVWLLGVGGAFRNSGDTAVVFGLWQAFGVVLDLGFAYRARMALKRGLRYGSAAASISVRE